MSIHCLLPYNTNHYHKSLKTMKKAFILITVFLLIVSTSCNHDEETITSTLNIEKSEGTVLSMTAGMPGNEDPADTRLALEQDGLNIKLTWEAGDKIYFVFAEGGTAKGKHSVTLTDDNILNEGKSARFNIIIPPEIISETFDLYGVYGVAGFAGETSYDFALKPSPWSGITLAEVQNKDVVMLKFSKMGISKTNPEVKVTFEHTGSLFHIVLHNNAGYALTGINRAELLLLTPMPVNVVQYSGSTTYSPVINTFSGAMISPFLPFDIIPAILPPGNSLEFWAWYPPIPGEPWPELSLRVFSANGIYTSINNKPQRTTPTIAGKAYHFYASFNGAELQLINSNGIPDTGIFMDPRDNNVYKTLTFGTQTWMAENLAFLPSVSGSSGYSETVPHYYVYDYHGYSPVEAKSLPNYQKYGVLYNWLAATTDACPPGWHLPSDSEWTQLEVYLANNGHNYDSTNGFIEPSTAGIKIAKSLASAESWAVSSVVGSVGNNDYPEYRNKSGFTALPGGFFSGGMHSLIDTEGFWWTSTTEYSTAIVRNIYYSGYAITAYPMYKIDGFSVRCVKNP